MVNYGLERDFAHKYAISLTLNRETKFKVAYYKPYTYIPVVFWKDMTIRPRARGQGKKKESNSGFQSYDLRLNIWHRSMVQRYCTPFPHKHYCLQYKKDRVKVIDIWFYIEVWYDIFYLKKLFKITAYTLPVCARLEREYIWFGQGLNNFIWP